MDFSMIKARIADAGEPSDRRQAPRFSIEVGARVRELGSEGSEARLINISEKGFMAESEGDFEVGSRIWLLLPGRDRASAVVRWTAGNRLGAEFAEPVSLEGLKV